MFGSKKTQKQLEQELIKIKMLLAADPGFTDEYKAQVSQRSLDPDWIQYLNGNAICEINQKTGTMIMTSSGDDFNLIYPVNIDLNISNRCEIGCPFCYQGCTPKGKEANIKYYLRHKKNFLHTLRPGTELAINGNEPLHPDLPKLLDFCQRKGILANLTVNERTFLSSKDTLIKWLNAGLIHGLGISPSQYSEEFLYFAANCPQVVVHTIVGVTSKKQYFTLFQRGIKVLILGYKLTGRGAAYQKEEGVAGAQSQLFLHNKEGLKRVLQILKDDLSFVSFDNLAIQQLDPKKLLSIPDDQYQLLYRGDDGQHTMFIDMVSEFYAKNSIQQKKNRKPLLPTIDEMFADIKKENKKHETSN